MSGSSKSPKSTPAEPVRAEETTETVRPPRWKWGLGLLVGWTALEAMIWFGLDPDRTMQWLFTWIVFSAATTTLAIWWFGFSRLSWKIRVWGIVAVLVVLLALAAIFRVDSYSGAFAPNFAFRWSPTRQEQAAEYWKQQATTRAKAADVAPEQRVETSLDPADDWAEFRGPLRDGVVRRGSLKSAGGDLPDWRQRPPRQIWRHPIGGGMGSFAVVGNRAVTIEQRGEDETVVCYEFETGRELWSQRAPAHYSTVAAGDGPRSTPTVVDGRVYAMGALGSLRCLDLSTGNMLWSHDTVPEAGAENPIYGTAVSPLVHSNLVIVNPGGPKGESVVAYHATTGERVWSAGNDQAAYVSPQRGTLDGVEQILIYDSLGPKGLQPQIGSELWRYDWSNTPRIHCSQPLVIDDRHVLISSGYGRGSILLKVEQTENGWKCEEVWKTRDLKLKFNSGVLHRGYVYGLDEGILTCLDLKTGKRVWKEGRYGFGQTLLVEDLLLIQAESGEVVVVAASPDGHRVITRFDALKDKTWNIPVLCRGRLLVRNETEAACYDLSSTASESSSNPK